MKRPLKIILPIFLVLASGIVLLFALFTRPVRLGFTEKITLNHVYAGKDIHVEITDKDDFARLISICRGRAVNDGAVPSCGCGPTPELIFEGKGKRVALYPGGDTCGTMRLGEEDKYFYGLSEKNFAVFREILAKYGVTFPCL